MVDRGDSLTNDRAMMVLRPAAMLEVCRVRGESQATERDIDWTLRSC